MGLIGPHPGTNLTGINKLASRIVVPEQQRADIRAAAFGVGPADDDKFIAVEVFGLEPGPAIARAVRGIEALRDDALEPGAQACS